jgi:hypothetical protein
MTLYIDYYLQIQAKGVLKTTGVKLMYNEFHKKWPMCALTFTTNYLYKKKKPPGSPFWTGRGHCKVSGCIVVKLTMIVPTVDNPNVEVKCQVNGSCNHDKSPTGV